MKSRVFAASQPPVRRSLWIVGSGLLLAAAILTGITAHASQADDLTVTNIVEEYQRQLDAGTAKLAYADSGQGYLPDLLRAFHIPRGSQLLVFSASSLQFDRINQKTPRALYYQDNVSVGSVQGGRLIEILTADKESGVAFYTLDVAKADKPKFIRRTNECITCHGYTSHWAPGMMVANFSTGLNGQPLYLDPSHPFWLTDDRTPFEDRYGGWYVTGNTGTMQHRGNVTLDLANPSEVPVGGLNIANLSDRIDTARYLEPGSDIVSLLTLEHQAGFVNLITRINSQYRGLDNPELAPALQATKQDIDTSIEELVAYMTFVDEVPLPSPVKGSSSFAEVFAGQGPHDVQGRSLRHFDLTTHVFRYPLSYMIHSQAFENLTPRAKERVLRRLYAVLSGADKAGRYADVSVRGGLAAINILSATKAGLPDFWKPIAERPTQQF